MQKTPDYDLAPHLARGRQLRSQAFLNAIHAVRIWLKGAVVSAPKTAGRAQNA